MNQPRRTAAEMYPLLELFDQRTESVAAFCASHDVSQAQLYYWRRKYQQKKASSQGDAFVEISSPTMGPVAPVEVAYPSGVRVRFNAQPSPAYLATLLRS